MKILPIFAISAAIALGAASFASAQGQIAPSANPNATQNPALKSPDRMANAPLAKGHNSFTEAEARARIQKAGYAHVTGLVLDSEGLWQAHATRDGRPVTVALDYKGDVATQ